MTKRRMWNVSYDVGCLQGPEWRTFVVDYNLNASDNLIFNIDTELQLIAMVFGSDGCECTYSWYLGGDD